MDKSKKLTLSIVFLVAVCVVAVAVSFVLPQAQAESSTANTDEHTETENESIITAESSQIGNESDASHNEVRLGPVESPIQILANDLNHTFTTEEAEKYPQLTDIPTLYINLDNNKKVKDIKHGVPSGATYTLVENGEGIFEQPLSIKGRGNYSWNMSDKKTYALNLSEQADLLGMGAAKSWILIANYNDRTLMRNYITLTFSRMIGMEFAPECKHIDLYFNGEYHGNYLLIEKIQINSQRVNINDDIGGLFEIERQFRHGDCTYCIECPSGVHITYKEPGEDDIGAEKKKENLEKFKVQFIKADIAITKGYEYYSRYIDVDSFIDWYIINEFVKNYDSGFTTSCYCYIGNDGLIHMGPVWDYDTCMANQKATSYMMNPDGYHVAQAGESWSAEWYVTLMQDDDFYDLLSKRWTELVDNGMLEWFFNEWYVHDELIAESVVLNYKRWPASLDYHDRGELKTYTHADEIEYVIDFMSARYNWLCERWYIGDNAPTMETGWYDRVAKAQNRRR